MLDFNVDHRSQKTRAILVTWILCFDSVMSLRIQQGLLLTSWLRQQSCINARGLFVDIIPELVYNTEVDNSLA